MTTEMSDKVWFLSDDFKPVGLEKYDAPIYTRRRKSQTKASDDEEFKAILAYRELMVSHKVAVVYKHFHRLGFRRAVVRRFKESPFYSADFFPARGQAPRGAPRGAGKRKQAAAKPRRCNAAPQKKRKAALPAEGRSPGYAELEPAEQAVEGAAEENQFGMESEPL